MKGLILAKESKLDPQIMEFIRGVMLLDTFEKRHLE